jgi:predicted nucleic acid-binding protein
VAVDDDNLVLDSEGLSEAARSADVWTTVMTARSDGRAVHVSALTLTEVLRGHARDASVHAVLKQCDVVPVTAAIGRAAGELLGRTGRKDTVDAIVAVTAAAAPRPVTVLTSDPEDLGALTAEQAWITVERV